MHPQNQELLLSSILFKQQRVQLATTKTTGHHIESHKQTAIEYNGNQPWNISFMTTVTPVLGSRHQRKFVLFMFARGLFSIVSGVAL